MGVKGKVEGGGGREEGLTAPFIVAAHGRENALSHNDSASVLVVPHLRLNPHCLPACLHLAGHLVRQGRNAVLQEL